MSDLKIALIWIFSVLTYITIAIVVSVLMTITIRRKKLGDPLSDDDHIGIAFSSILPVVGICYLGWNKLYDVLNNPKKEKKCILCGIKNDSDHAHCKHCGNLFT